MNAKSNELNAFISNNTTMNANNKSHGRFKANQRSFLCNIWTKNLPTIFLGCVMIFSLLTLCYSIHMLQIEFNSNTADGMHTTAIEKRELKLGTMESTTDNDPDALIRL